MEGVTWAPGAECRALPENAMSPAQRGGPYLQVAVDSFCSALVDAQITL